MYLVDKYKAAADFAAREICSNVSFLSLSVQLMRAKSEIARLERALASHVRADSEELDREAGELTSEATTPDHRNSRSPTPKRPAVM